MPNSRFSSAVPIGAVALATALVASVLLPARAEAGPRSLFDWRVLEPSSGARLLERKRAEALLWDRHHRQRPRIVFRAARAGPPPQAERQILARARLPALAPVPTVIGIRRAPVGEPVVYQIERRGDGRRGEGRGPARVIDLGD